MYKFKTHFWSRNALCLSWNTSWWLAPTSFWYSQIFKELFFCWWNSKLNCSWKYILSWHSCNVWHSTPSPVFLFLTILPWERKTKPLVLTALCWLMFLQEIADFLYEWNSFRELSNLLRSGCPWTREAELMKYTYAFAINSKQIIFPHRILWCFPLSLSVFCI